jgi:putative ABC transport system permease protein
MSFLRYFRRIRWDDVRAEELRSYVDIETEANIARGMPAGEARHAAQRKLGNAASVREEIYRMNSLVFLETLQQDLQYGFRTLFRRNPGFTLVALAALTLGIGFNTAMFSVLNSVLLRPLPYPDSERLVLVWENSRRQHNPRNVVAAADFLDWQARNHVFTAMSAMAGVQDTLTGAGEPEEVAGLRVNASYFSLLGVHPLMGRTFTAEEDRPRAPAVVLISHRLWTRKFGADASVIGRTIVLEGEPHMLIGVMPPGFQSLGSTPDIVMPLGFDPARDYRSRGGRYLRVLARLKPGVTLEQAQREMDAIGAALQKEHVQFNTGWGVTLVRMDDQITGGARPALLVLMGAVGFVLLIACANVANLLLARAATRGRELAVRVSLGAGPGRILRQLLTEGIVLATAGCLSGGLLAVSLVRWLRILEPPGLPRVQELNVDWKVLLFTAGLSLMAGVIFGLAPAFHARQNQLADAIMTGRGNLPHKRQQRVGNVFIALEAAVAVILLVGAGLMTRTLLRLQAVNPGFDARNLLTMEIDLPGGKYGEPSRQVNFFESAVQEVRRLPGVIAVGAIAGLPFAGMAPGTSFHAAGRPAPAPGQAPVAEVRVIHPEYFRAMRIPLLQGRNFDSRDYRQGAPRVYVVNQELAQSEFPNEDPIGKHLVVDMADSIPGEIIGVTGGVLTYGLSDAVKPMVYYVNPQLPLGYTSLAIRTAGDPMRLAPQVIAAIHSLDKDQPVSDVQTMEDRMTLSTARTRYTALLLALFAAVAMALAGSGIYGVTSYTVARRTQEIGVRMALGAGQWDVWTMVIRQGMAPVAAGMAAGAAASLAITRFLSSLLFGVGSRDPVTYLAVSVFLALVALMACLIPARRATRVEPLRALNYE